MTDPNFRKSQKVDFVASKTVFNRDFSRNLNSEIRMFMAKTVTELEFLNQFDI